MIQVPLALYVHIPFCSYRCRYCNFTFETGWSPALMDRTLDALVAEAHDLVAQGVRDGIEWRVRTLYLGGGTPGVVPPEKMVRLLEGLERALGYRTRDLAEATLEANPENVREETLAAWGSAGLNRLSLGIQTFDSERLALLGRWCDGPTNRRALDLVASTWSGRWTADLMTGLPGQSSQGPASHSPASHSPSIQAPQRWVDLRRDLDELLSYQPGHVSLYSLTVEPETDLATLQAGGALRVCDDPVADQLWLRARQTLLERGFEWYEISNFARGGHRSLHNQAYWRLDPWAGLGPGAEGTLPARTPDGRLLVQRTRNPRLFPWLTGQRTREWLSAPEFALEHFVAGWRTADGLVPGRFPRLFQGQSITPIERLSAEQRLFLNQELGRIDGLETVEWRADWASEVGL